MSNSTATVLGANLRRLRVAARMSLSELARATGVGKATLSAVENGRGNPTVDTLATLAAAFGVPVADLLDTPEAPPVTVVRARDREGVDAVGRLAGGELQRALLPARSDIELPAQAAAARAHVVVTRGTLVAGPVEHVTELGRGDYASFPADRPYILRTGARAAEAVMVVERP